MGKEETGNTGQIGVLKTLTHEILLTKAAESDREGVLELYLDEDASQDKIIEYARRETAIGRWWLWEYWEQKGLPKEQVELTDGEHTINLYNYREEPVPEQQLEQIKRILQIFSGIRGGIAFNAVKYILLDDVQGMNDKSGDLTNGYGPVNSYAVTLYPNALRAIPNRVTDKVTNLEGTITHELTHGIPEMILDGEMFLNNWVKVTGWEIAEERRKLPGGATSIWETDSSRCVTDYATSDPDEDICESMVAYLFDPEKLDPEKLRLLQTALPFDLSKESHWSSKHIKDIQIPETPQELNKA